MLLDIASNIVLQQILHWYLYTYAGSTPPAKQLKIDPSSTPGTSGIYSS